ncbi:hypothetical protein P280DRAFT_486002 [Massarina eburnea CBS 473.64]|uniref:Cylicin I n=1 Tax=Massarina eburnea CBS 473.64 TaxID=1395130 RepID=A0A6A6SJA6_9PLEO|nr:hypothetical protein P280DRAFT_486002 [Massarina eburnea CBS 473.64]
MSFARSAALRASSLARCARTARIVRAAELQQPWQRTIQRRTYASAHGGEAVKKSDLPWAVGAVVSTVVGLYVVVNQDTGGHHDEHHDEAHEEHEESQEESKEDQPEEKAEDKSEDKPEKKSDEKAENKPEKSDDKSEEKKDKKDESKDNESSPDDSDKPTPRKDSKSQNETSGKQEGLSNTDTKHSTQIDQDDQKSKKGEGSAETAKLKGTVSTDRPQAENKEERGQSKSDKN